MPRRAGPIGLPRCHGMQPDARSVLAPESVAVVYIGHVADEPIGGRRCQPCLWLRLRLDRQHLLHLRNQTFKVVVQWPIDHRQKRRRRHTRDRDCEAPRMAATACPFGGRRRMTGTTTVRAAHHCNLSLSDLKRVEPPPSPTTPPTPHSGSWRPRPPCPAARSGLSEPRPWPACPGSRNWLARMSLSASAHGSPGHHARCVGHATSGLGSLRVWSK